MMTEDDDYTQPRHVEISFETRCSANLINAVQICHVHGPIIVLFPWHRVHDDCYSHSLPLRLRYSTGLGHTGTD